GRMGRRQCHGRAPVEQGQVQSAASRSIAAGARARRHGAGGARPQPAVHVGGAAEAGVSAAVQPLPGRHDHRLPCRQRGADAPPELPVRIRTDVSSTLFISAPEDYDGGELVVEDTYGSHRVKLPAGDMIVYPGTSLHHVTPITRGSRIASFFWTQSMVRDVT